MHTDIIHFNLPANTTINLQFGVSLDVSQPMTIDGCFPVVAATAPCVGINGSAINSTTMDVAGNGATVRGLPPTGGQPESIFTPCCTTGLTVRNDWFGVTITGGSVSGGAGLDLRGTGAVIGGTALGDRNVFANNAGEIGIDGGDDNQVIGNYFGVAPDGVTTRPTVNAPSIKITKPFSDASTGNVIGGLTSASENLISNTSHAGSPAIQIDAVDQTGNQVLRNRGTANSGQFIDLSPPDGFGNNALTGANGGIQAPTSQAAPGLVFGSAAPGATVLVYQGDGNAGDLLGFLGAAQADGSGAWSLQCSLICANEPASGTLVTAGQTDGSGNSSE